MFFESFISFIISFLFGASTLVIGARNPIHSILILILVFFLGSILLFLLSMEYFAILFLIVYVGAIVILFLFIVMMLEIKMVNSSERFSDLFSFKNIILGFLVLEILFFSNEEFWDITPVLKNDIKFNWNLTEINLYTDYSKVLNYIGQLKAIGGILFSQYFIAIILISILLFVSMFGSIVMTLESTKRIIIKQQDATLQGFRTPVDKIFSKDFLLSAAVSSSEEGRTWIGYFYNCGTHTTKLICENPIHTVAIVLASGGVIYVTAAFVIPYVCKVVATASIVKITSDMGKDATIVELSKKLAAEQSNRVAAEVTARSTTEKLAEVTANLATEQSSRVAAEVAARSVTEKLAEVSANLVTAQAGKAAAEAAKIISQTNNRVLVNAAKTAVNGMSDALQVAVSEPVRHALQREVVNDIGISVISTMAEKPGMTNAIIRSEFDKATEFANLASYTSMKHLGATAYESVNIISVEFIAWLQQFTS